MIEISVQEWAEEMIGRVERKAAEQWRARSGVEESAREVDSGEAKEKVDMEREEQEHAIVNDKHQLVVGENSEELSAKGWKMDLGTGYEKSPLLVEVEEDLRAELVGAP